jgi:hypothetical protein
MSPLARLRPPIGKDPSAAPAAARQTFERMIAMTSALPGVQSVALVSRAPLTGGWSSNGLIAEGKPLDPSSLVNAELQIVSPNYLSTARLPLKAGRNFNAQDTRDRTLVTIANETLARTMWRGINPIGKRFACCESGPQGRMDPVWHEVIGVVGDVRAGDSTSRFSQRSISPSRKSLRALGIG